ncbi:hypothetical protein N7462_009956 [Penicillium macrosclerotiorum]|uniref:uncharacterized protein n=1 Tax=Penicillium macrosclerotiorum TaxID=303699 RepID=UPI002549A619|nr:uncharacterized protein N7462_009956 [Penicillium macrosclerotiorum]KAJ5668886.1 hypothetical protein N7462_009956 [Penicillium macrosclerotiorum]
MYEGAKVPDIWQAPDLLCVLVRSANALANDVLTWTTSISRSRVSTVDGLGFSENVDVEAMNSLESLLRTVQQLKLQRLRAEDLEEIRFVAAGETFAVSECKYEGTVVAIKRIRLNEDGRGGSDRQYFQRRLQSVLREVLIMCHPPLSYHPNIIDLLGYGWNLEGQRTSPFISVEFGSKGTLRAYMKDGTQPLRNKLILMGDVGAGLMALHKCGIIHGDLKMDNVVVFASLDRPSGSIAKVSDFGHSIIVSSASEKRIQYFGTSLYNAPEVSEQKNQPIPVEQLHKCDIWAFGLCAWEILSNGQIYFQRSWRYNPLFERSSSQSTPLTSPGGSDAPEELSIEEDDQNVFGRFDISNLKNLAVEFINNMKIPGSIGFEKGFLRPLLDRTLQMDPAKRISDLSRLPIIVSWHKTPGGHSLQSKLATYAISGDIRYSIFSRDAGPYIIWDQQQQLLLDFEAVAQKSQGQKRDSSIVFQTMLCYVNIFGTSKDLAKAAHFLHMAEEAGHLIARIMGPRMLDGFEQNSINVQREYHECLALGFSILRSPDLVSPMVVTHGESTTNFTNYAHFREMYVNGEVIMNWQKETIQEALVTLANPKASPKPQSLLEIAVQYDNLELMEKLIPFFADRLDELNAVGESLLVQAASRGHGEIVISLLKANAKVAPKTSASLLHWLFCLDESTLAEIQDLLQHPSRRSDLELSVDHAMTEKIVLHPQWPFQVDGTPLAVAIAAGSIAAVKLLLELKADPLAPTFVAPEGDSAPILTPIHLAVRYHSPEILVILWKAAFGEDKTTGIWGRPVAALGSFPIACTLSLLTNAERLAIHGNEHKDRLRSTIQLLSLATLLQTSPEGRNAITQAIDLEDVDCVELLLARCPQLAGRQIGQTNNKAMFTYPFHFAVLVGSNRDTAESEQILETILKLDPSAFDRPDSISTKPLHIAAMGSSDRITKFLLNRGASCNDLADRGQNPLHFCRVSANVKTLLLNGADLDQRNLQGFTAVHVAVTRGATDVLKCLIEAKADLSFGDNAIGTPLHCAMQRKSRPMAEMLVAAGVDVNARNGRGRTPLHLAMDAGRSDLASFLLEHGADPFIEDKHGASAFRMSLAWENASVFQKFQQHPSSRTMSMSSHIAALHFAAGQGEPIVLAQYLSTLSQAILNVQRRYATTIHAAAATCRVDLLEVLVAYRFDPRIADHYGNTALLVAAQAGRSKTEFYAYYRTYMCEKLLQSGADLLAKNYKNQTPFQIARAHGDCPLMTLFLQHVLTTNAIDTAKKRARIVATLRNPADDEKNCEEARRAIGDELIDPQLVAYAASVEEWDFVMTCIGGHFVSKTALRTAFKQTHYTAPSVDSIDLLRYFAADMDREMVRYIHAGRPGNSPEGGHGARSVGRRNLDIEFVEARRSLNEMLWPEIIESKRSEAQRKKWQEDPDYKYTESALRNIWTGVREAQDTLVRAASSAVNMASRMAEEEDIADFLAYFASRVQPIKSVVERAYRLKTLKLHCGEQRDMSSEVERQKLWLNLFIRAGHVEGVHGLLSEAFSYINGNLEAMGYYGEKKVGDKEENGEDGKAKKDDEIETDQQNEVKNARKAGLKPQDISWLYSLPENIKHLEKLGVQSQIALSSWVEEPERIDE